MDNNANNEIHTQNKERVWNETDTNTVHINNK